MWPHPLRNCITALSVVRVHAVGWDHAMGVRVLLEQVVEQGVVSIIKQKNNVIKPTR